MLGLSVCLSVWLSVYRRLNYTTAAAHTIYRPNLFSTFQKISLNSIVVVAIAAGMQDFNYLSSNCFEITVEMGCDKFPPGNQLPQYWSDNMRSMIEYMWQVRAWGVTFES